MLVVAGLNLVIIVAGSLKHHSYGYHVMFLGILPLGLLGLSAFYWYPPDWLSWAACLALVLGLGIGGAMLSKEKGYGVGRGIGLALVPPSVGLAILVFLPARTVSEDRREY